MLGLDRDQNETVATEVMFKRIGRLAVTSRRQSGGERDRGRETGCGQDGVGQSGGRTSFGGVETNTLITSVNSVEGLGETDIKLVFPTSAGRSRAGRGRNLDCTSTL